MASYFLLVFTISLLILSTLAKSPLQFFREPAEKSVRSLKKIFSLSRQYTQDPCTSNADCKDSRQCIFHKPRGESLCFDRNRLICTSKSDCLAGDRCIAFSSESFECVSCNFELNRIQNAVRVVGADCVCVAIESLTEFDKSSLVFDAHRRASVLCDQHENCATPGHIVVYKSNPMAMSTYCTQHSVSCRRTVKLVNSPKMKLGLRFSSFSNDLKFTALAAAKETFFEEAVLKIAVSFGI